MSGSFFLLLIEKLPQKRSTQAMLMIGIIGCLGLTTSFILFLSPTQSSENEQIVLSVTPAPDMQIEVEKVDVQSSGLDSLNLTTDTKVSVNTATLKQLEELPYIGEKKASTITAARPYASIDEFFSRNPFSEEQAKKLVEMIKL